MAVHVHLILKDDGGAQIMGSFDVHGVGTIEQRVLHLFSIRAGAYMFRKKNTIPTHQNQTFTLMCNLIKTM